MDNKDLIARFVEDSFRFEALHQEIDGLIAEADSEVLAYEYEDLANQAAEIVLKLSANGNNVGERFFNYYVERLEYIIDYFRALLDYEETPLAEDKQGELADEKARYYRKIGEFFAAPAEIRFAGDPADCAFPKSLDFYIKKIGVQVRPERPERPERPGDEADAVEAADGEDERSDEVDNENDAQTAESDEAAAAPAAGVPLPLEEKPCPSSEYRGLGNLTSENLARVRDTFAMWFEMNEATGRNRNDGKTLPAAEILKRADFPAYEFEYEIKHGDEHRILVAEQKVRKTICETIDAIPDFRDSEEFKKLIEEYPTYKEIVEL